MNLIDRHRAVDDRGRRSALTVFLRASRCSPQSLRFGGTISSMLLPRIAIGMIGSGFIAEILPKELIPALARPG